MLGLLLTVVLLAAAVGGGVLLVLKHPRVRAYAVNQTTEWLGEKLGTEVSIGNLDFHFPARIELDDVYLEDTGGDTLASVGRLYAHFSPARLLEHTIRFSQVEIDQVYGNVYQERDSIYNYQFIVDAFARPDTTRKVFDWNVEVGRFELTRVRGNFCEHTFRLDTMELLLPHFSLDSVRADVSVAGVRYVNPRLKTRNEVRVNRCELSALLNDTVWALPRLYVLMPGSELDASGVRVGVPRTDSFDLKKNAHDMDLHLHINHARFTPADIAAIVPRLRHMTRELELSADIEGRLDSIEFYRLDLSYDHLPVLQGDVRVLGFPSPDSTYIRAQCSDLCIRPHMVEDIVSRLTASRFALPEEVHRLGKVHYRGLLTGFSQQLNLQGALSTDMGSIATYGTFTSDTVQHQLCFGGRLATSRFRLGTMLDRPALGDLSLSVRAMATKRDSLPLEADFDVEGGLNALALQMAAAGRVGVQNSVRLNLSVDELHAANLREIETEEDAVVSLVANASADWSSLDDLQAMLEIDSVFFARPSLEDTLRVDEATVKVESGRNNYHRLLISTPHITSRLEGNFDPRTLGATFSKLAVKHLPGLFEEKDARRIMAQPSSNQLDFYLYGHHLQQLQYMLGLPVRVSDYPVLKAYVNESKDVWGLQGFVSDIHTSRIHIGNITLSANKEDDRAHLDMSADWAGTAIQLHSLLRGDSLTLDLRGDGDTAVVRGDAHLSATFMRYAGHPHVTAHIYPTTIIARDSVFRIDPSVITYCAADTMLTVDHFRIGTETQFIMANGAASARMTDSLVVLLGRIDPSAILPLVLPENTLTAGGSLSGIAVAYNIFRQPIFTADVRLGDALLNGSPLGDAYARLYLSDDRSHMVIDGDVYSAFDEERILRANRSHMAHVDGYVDLIKHDGSWGIDISSDSLGLGFIEHWVQGILTDIGGTVSGNVKVSGKRGETYVVARALPHNGHLTIPYTGCTYYLNDSCFLDSTGIYFPHLTLRDRENNPIWFDGSLKHNIFQDWIFDLNVRMDHALALDLPYKDGEIMQGKVYARGGVRIAGDDRLIRLQANARAVGDSRFRMSIDGASSAGSDAFITWVDHNEVKLISTERDYSIKKWVNPVFAKNGKLPTRFVMDIGVEADPQLMFQLMLDDKTGDMIQGRGDGAIKLTYDANTNDFRMAGTYTVQSGKMDFTVANAFHRDFTIAEGSTISWTSDPASPTLDITAKYHVTASLKDLFGTETETLVSGRTSIPVNTCVHMTGPLFNPTVRFSLELPMSEEAIQTQVRSIVNTDEMMMREVIYLIVFGRFYTPESLMSNKQIGGLNETYSLLSSTITGQINNWLSKLTEVFTMGFNIRTDGQGAGSSQEYEANFQIMPVSRLIINGNFGYRYNDVSNRPFFGDLDVEYMLTPNGKLRAKAYTHTVDKYSMRQATMIEGVGLIFKHDFNWGDTRRNREMRKAKREKESLSDSTAVADKPARKNKTQKIKKQQ